MDIAFSDTEKDSEGVLCIIALFAIKKCLEQLKIDSF